MALKSQIDTLQSQINKEEQKAASLEAKAKYASINQDRADYCAAACFRAATTPCTTVSWMRSMPKSLKPTSTALATLLAISARYQH
jgi:hypothetical protein